MPRHPCESPNLPVQCRCKLPPRGPLGCKWHRNALLTLHSILICLAKLPNLVSETEALGASRTPDHKRASRWRKQFLEVLRRPCSDLPGYRLASEEDSRDPWVLPLLESPGDVSRMKNPTRTELHASFQ